MSGLTGNIPLNTAPRSEAPSAPQLNSLEEPVSETIVSARQKRDLLNVLAKLKVLLLFWQPVENRLKEVRDWDLWGPLLICLLLAVTLSLGSENDRSNTASLVFGIVFLVIWVGAAVVTVSAQLLGSQVSFFQSVCLLGYCVFPLTAAALLSSLLSFLPAFIELVLAAVGFSWSVAASLKFVTHLVPENKRILAAYPIFLFFLFLGWFIVVV